MATEKQTKYIHTLAAKAGMKVNPSAVKQMDNIEASRYIDKLQDALEKKGIPVKPRFNPMTLGLASKLVNERWTAGKMNPLKYPSEFILQVEKTYNLLSKAEKALNAA